MNIITQSSSSEVYRAAGTSSGSGNVSGTSSGTSSSHTHLHYTCLPSSTALSPNAHVTIAIRSFHTNIHPTNLKSLSTTSSSSSLPLPSSSSSSLPSPPSSSPPLLLPSSSSFSSPSSSRTKAALDHGTQLYVSAQVLGIGSLPLHSNTIDSTASSIMCPTRTRTNTSLPTIDMNNNNNPNHYYYNPFSTNQYYCTWDDHNNNNTTTTTTTTSTKHQSQQNHQQQHQQQQHQYQNNILTLPIRYKDLSHDACIKVQIYTSRNVVIGTVVLSLWDDDQKLKMGLQKLKVDLVMNNSATTSSSATTSATSANNNNNNNAKDIMQGEKEKDQQEVVVQDEKWEACLILDKLQQIETMTKTKKEISMISSTTSTSTSTTNNNNNNNISTTNTTQEKHHGHHRMEDLNITVNGLRNCNPIQSVPWLDSLTTSYCMDVLNDNNNHHDNDSHDNNNDNNNDDNDNDNSHDKYNPYGGIIGNNLGVSNGNAYLIVELQQCDVPIIHHEQSYGNGFLQGGTTTTTSTTTTTTGNNGNNNGSNGSDGGGNGMISHNSSASGSITALDLSLYHHQYKRQYGHLHNNTNSNIDANTNTNANTKANANANANTVLHMPNLVHALNESQEMGMKLVQVLDFESVDDNPVEDKYRTLQHELLRGLVDPALKPDALERSHLNAIISSTTQHLTREEKDLLWRFRFSLVDNRRALTKFLLAVEWTVESEVVQAAELLEQWRKRSPIEVSDALKLLGKNVAFQTGLVRAYAIDTLALADDGELVLYLLQLVQALKYETTTDEQSGLNGLKQFRRSTNTKKGSKNNNSLAAFLIERASKNIQLANYLYWYLKVELGDPMYGKRYKEVFMALKTKLSRLPYKVESDKHQQQHGQSKFIPLSGVLTGNSKKATSVYRTMWNVLETQDHFISDIVECQLESQEARGKKDAKEKHLRESLQKKGCHTINNGISVPLPSAPQIWVTGVKADSARMFKSALYPALLEFYVDQNSSNDETNPDGSKLSIYKVMVKTGDDLRQDQLVIMMIKLMDRILKRGTLDLFLKPYPILAMSDRTGLVEFVPDSMAISQILAENNNSILEYFQKVASSKGDKHGVDPDVMQTYVRSCAGYCVITYLIGVGDRHLDNIMLQRSGHFFHIDFGFIFGRDPKPLPPAFRLTREMVDGMGGQDSHEYRQFCSLACQAYNLLRKRAGLVLNLLHLMSDAGIEDLSNHPSANAEGVIAEVEKRFKLDLTDEQAESYFVQLIKESVSALAPRVMDVFHQIAVARR